MKKKPDVLETLLEINKAIASLGGLEEVLYFMGS